MRSLLGVFYIVCLLAPPVWSSSVVVSKRFLAVGEVVKAPDLDLIELHKAVPSNAVTDPSAVVGRVARTSINPGRPLFSHNFKVLYLIKKHDSVNIAYNSGNVNISLKGKAMENGAMDDVVKIRSNLGGEIISARVVGIMRASADL